MADTVGQTSDPGRLAVLLGSLVKGLASCPAGAVREAAGFLEAGLHAEALGVDDLGAKLEAVLRPGTPLEDRVHSLWLLHISLFRPELRTLVWIGPALAGADTESCLRLGAGQPGPDLDGLARELTVLASALAPGLAAAAADAGAAGVKFSLRRNMEAGSTPSFTRRNLL